MGFCEPFKIIVADIDHDTPPSKSADPGLSYRLGEGWRCSELNSQRPWEGERKLKLASI